MFKIETKLTDYHDKNGGPIVMVCKSDLERLEAELDHELSEKIYYRDLVKKYQNVEDCNNCRFKEGGVFAMECLGCRNYFGSMFEKKDKSHE